jgi:binding-protein-dependent transport system inner membrane component
VRRRAADKLQQQFRGGAAELTVRSSDACQRRRKQAAGRLVVECHDCQIIRNSAAFLWVVSAAVKTNQEVFGGPGLPPSALHLENFSRAWTQASIGLYFLNTTIVAVCSVGIVLVTTGMLGYVLGRYSAPGKRVILAESGGSHVIYVLLFAGFFSQLPGELQEAAIIDGAGFVRIFGSIMLPLAGPIIATTTILQFMSSWTAFSCHSCLPSHVRTCARWALACSHSRANISRPGRVWPRPRRWRCCRAWRCSWRCSATLWRASPARSNNPFRAGPCGLRLFAAR